MLPRYRSYRRWRASAGRTPSRIHTVRRCPTSAMGHSAMHIGQISLTSQLNAFRAGLLARLPPSERDAILHAAEDLRAGSATRNSPECGERAPAFDLPDQHGRTVRLMERLAHGPVVLLFVRGGWLSILHLDTSSLSDGVTRDRGGRRRAPCHHPTTGRELQRPSRSVICSLSQCFPTRATTSPTPMAWPTNWHPRCVVSMPGSGMDLPRLNGTGDWRVPLPATFVIGADGHGRARPCRSRRTSAAGARRTSSVPWRAWTLVSYDTIAP